LDGEALRKKSIKKRLVQFPKKKKKKRGNRPRLASERSFFRPDSSITGKRGEGEGRKKNELRGELMWNEKRSTSDNAVLDEGGEKLGITINGKRSQMVKKAAH